MEIEFGYVQKYNIERGFGFVSRTFYRTHQLNDKDVWFHIKMIKRDYPNLAKDLDSGVLTNISFWYELDNRDGQKVNKIWLDSQDIPEQKKDDLSIYIQQIWNNIKSPVPKWLDQVTLILLGQAYKDELSQKRDQKILTQKKLEEKNNQTRQSNKDAIRELLRQQNLSRLSRNKQRRQSQLEQPKNILSHEELEEKVNQERQSNEDLIRELLKQQNSSRLSRSKQRRQSQLEQEKSINEEQVESQNSLRMSRRARRQAHPKNVYIGLPDNLGTGSA